MRYSAAMLASIKNIEANIGGLTNLIIRTNGFDASAAGIQTGTKATGILGGLTSALTGVSNFVGGKTGSMIGAGILAMLKLQNVEKFATMFLNYDLLAKRWVPYSRIYPFAEGLAGVLMAAGALNWLSIPVALFIGSVGAASVFKAVYIDKRELKCACVGGDSNVPLGFVSLTENVMMVAMALWMLFGPHTMGF